MIFNQQNKMKLEEEIVQWAEDKGIFEKSNPLKQHDKTIEEVIELRDAIITYECMCNSGEALEFPHSASIAKDEIKDGIGDTIVTLAILAKMHGLTLTDCVDHAYNEIKERKGKMVNGVFVKD